MFKNVASQKVIVFAFDSTTNLPKTGDSANITAYVSKDYGSVTVLGDTSATEMDATNAKGYYLFDLTQAETNGDTLLFSAKSATSNIVVVGAPATVFTYPTTGILAPTTSGRTLVVDANGLADANTVKLGPSGSGTAQTARDVGASVLLSAGTGTGQLDFTSGVVKANLAQILGTALTETAGLLAGGFKKFFNIASPVSTMDVLARVTLTDTVTTYTGNTPQTGDSFARLGAPAGASHAVDTAAVKTDTAAIKLKTDNLPAIPAAVGSAMTLTSGERDSTADALLARNVAGGSSAGRLVKEALYVLRNKTDIQAGTLTVYGTDDTTSAFTAAVTTAAGNPITTVDPA
jgi:hypothetical protein